MGPYIELIDLVLKIFILKIELLYSINQLSEFNCEFLFLLGDLIQVLNALGVVLIDANLMPPDESQVVFKAFSSVRKYFSDILMACLFDISTQLDNELTMSAALFDFFPKTRSSSSLLIELYLLFDVI